MTNRTYKEAVLVNPADVPTKPVQWLWKDRFALGKLSALVRDCDVGKSFITLNIVALLPQGKILPGESGNSREPVGSIILSAEGQH